MMKAGHDDDGAEIISLERQRLRRRIRRRLRELRAAREKYENDPASEKRSRRIAEIADVVIQEVLGQS